MRTTSQAGLYGNRIAFEFGTIALRAGLAGSAVSAIGALQQGDATSQASQFNAAVARNNATAATPLAQQAAEAQQRQGAQADGRNSRRVRGERR
jgi:hypothetical protein